jgi:hypothetical protein
MTTIIAYFTIYSNYEAANYLVSSEKKNSNEERIFVGVGLYKNPAPTPCRFI